MIDSWHRYAEDDLLALSGIQHFAFCQRQWALIHIEHQWRENARTVEGHQVHERAHDPRLAGSDEDHIIARAVPLVSYELGLSGQADVVEFLPAEGDAIGAPLAGYSGLWAPRPVEYKRGSPKPGDCDIVQLCAQAMCLEEMLDTVIDIGHLYYAETRHRRRVALDESLRTRVRELAAAMHAVYDTGQTPRPSSTMGCSQCSLAEACVPEIALRPPPVTQYIHAELTQALADGDPVGGAG